MWLCRLGALAARGGDASSLPTCMPRDVCMSKDCVSVCGWSMSRGDWGGCARMLQGSPSAGSSQGRGDYSGLCRRGWKVLRVMLNDVRVHAHMVGCVSATSCSACCKQ
jgi:hypothetical protein